MATKITETFIESQGVKINESTKKALSYYEKASDIIKRTHNAMGRNVSFQTKVTSTVNGRLHCSILSTTR